MLLVEQHLHYAEVVVIARPVVMNSGVVRLELRADEIAGAEKEVERLYLADVTVDA